MGHTCQRCVSVFLLVINVVDIISGWLLFKDVYLIHESVIPNKDAITITLGVFCGIGTLLSFIEVLNLWKGKPWKHPDHASTAAMWGHFAQGIINVIVISYLKENLSEYPSTKVSTIFKTAIILFALVFRLIVYFVNCCNENRHKCCSFLFFLGTIGSLVCTIVAAVFIFTSSQFCTD